MYPSVASSFQASTHNSFLKWLNGHYPLCCQEWTSQFHCSTQSLLVKLLPTLRWWHNNTIIATKSIRENSIGLVDTPWIIHFCGHFKFQRLIHGNFQPKVRYNMCIGCNHALVAPVSCMGILCWIQPLFFRCALWEALSKENTQDDVHTRDLTFLG